MVSIEAAENVRGERERERERRKERERERERRKETNRERERISKRKRERELWRLRLFQTFVRYFMSLVVMHFNININ